jgi:hypothetical protein
MNSFWNNWRYNDISVCKVDSIDSSALALFLENSKRMCNDNNSAVEMATLNPLLWINDIAPIVMKRVDYICKTPAFAVNSYHDGVLTCYSYTCVLSSFDSDEKLIEFLNEKRFGIFVLFYIVKYVNLKDLTQRWDVKYCDIDEPSFIRNKKIDYIIDDK